MIKILKKIGLVVLIALGGVLSILYIYLQLKKPTYDGRFEITGLNQESEVYFDTYAIPHIYSKNEEDAYFTLGYVHAQERLFQMEVLRRVASGRLAEIFGKDLIATDRFFRTLGIQEASKQSVNQLVLDANKPYYKAMQAYVRGINEYISQGHTPVEFGLLGIKKERFTILDIYNIGGYMAFSFAEAFKTEPLLASIQAQFGPEFLNELNLTHKSNTARIPVSKPIAPQVFNRLSNTISQATQAAPVGWFTGSNSWVLAPNKSVHGGVLLCNDTHISFSQPSVWYEAHLECPGFSFYGNHLAGFPFALVGHSRFMGWSLTMLENDDIDFYAETIHPQKSNLVAEGNQWQAVKTREEVIHVNGMPDETIVVRSTKHGPIISDVLLDSALHLNRVLSVSWTFLKFPSQAPEAFYKLAHAQSLPDARNAVSLIAAPGLNISYGDTLGNIAWWAAAKLVERPKHVNSKLILDGASGKDEIKGYYPFAFNPMSENPSSGFIVTANNQPDSSAAGLYPGYYAPDDRAKRLTQLLKSKQKFTVDELQRLSLDHVNPEQASMAKQLALGLKKQGKRFTQTELSALNYLLNWDGNHHLLSIAPTIYYTYLGNLIHEMMEDEVGKGTLEGWNSSHTLKNSYKKLLFNDQSVWWDNVRTPEKESATQIRYTAFVKTIATLSAQLGENPARWNWQRKHQVVHPHAFGRQPGILARLFNVGPFPVAGGLETVNNQSFGLHQFPYFTAGYGPAMRISIDFKNIEQSQSINPTGQSGHFNSKYYDDQAFMFLRGQTRKQLMNRKEIEQVAIGKSVFIPVKQKE